MFTSGATGPAKGVVYRHRQVRGPAATLCARRYAVTADDRLVAAFAPFALYGPALGIASAVPDIDVTAPGTLTAAALADAARGRRRHRVFASPAALRNVVATADALDRRAARRAGRVRLLMSAGAPVPAAAAARGCGRCCRTPSAHTPYGMTEALPVTDISLAEIEAGRRRATGVCVGRPLPGVEVRSARSSPPARPTGAT